MKISELLYYENGAVYNKVDRGTKAKAGMPVKVHTHKTNGYQSFKLNSKNIMLHRAVYELNFGEIPAGFEIDHINRVRNDNRIENLRLVTSRENKLNRGNKGGVRKSLKKWQAYTYYMDKFIYIGVFDSEEEARQKQQEFCNLMEEECQI